MMNNIIEIRLGDLKVRKELQTIREMLLEGNTHKCSDCDICRKSNLPLGYYLNLVHIDGPCIQEDPNNKSMKWCACRPYYDWDTLKESLLTKGYQPEKSNDGYILIKYSVRNNKIVEGSHRVVDGNHRVILLKEIHDDDYMIKVRTIEAHIKLGPYPRN